MKKYVSLFLGGLVMVMSCRKQVAEAGEAATLTIVNTILQGQPVKLSTNTQVINNNTFANVGLKPGEADVYIFPVNDSLHQYYSSSKLVVGGGDIFTLLLGGSTTAPDAILIKEDLPMRIDSTMGVRFVNLSSGSPNVNVTLSTTPAILEFNNVQYKDVTEFRSYSVNSVNNSYTFQVRRADNGTLISSITLSGSSFGTGLPRFKNVTLVLRGLVSGSPAAGITRVNHY